MGRSIFSFESLGAPLSRVLHRVSLIPRGRRMLVSNRDPKIVILLDGEVKAMVNDRWLGTMSGGDILVVPGECKQVYAPLDRRGEVQMDTLVISFNPQLTVWDESLLRAAPIASGHEEDRSPEGLLMRAFGRLELRRSALTPAARGWISALQQEGEKKREGAEIRVTAYTLLLLAEIASGGAGGNLASEPSPEGPDRQAWLVEQTKHYLLEHHTEALTLDQIAWQLRVSGEHLARTFRKATGQTIFKHLEHLRVARAKTQLTTTRATVQEIAEKAGFATAAHFCRVFKRATQETPLSYRLRIAGDSSFSPSHTEEIVF